MISGACLVPIISVCQLIFSSTLVFAPIALIFVIAFLCAIVRAFK